MAVQNPFFGKRDTDAFNPRSPATGMGSTGSSFGAASQGNVGTAAPVAAPAAVTPAAAAAGDTSGEGQGGSKLIVGPNIKLKGVEITDCDTLVVEGTVEATMDSRVIEIAERGAFHGTAEIDVAEIRGVFEGTLIVRQKLVIYSTGKVSGKIRYGKVVIEEGGELTGQIEAGSNTRGNAAQSKAVPVSNAAASPADSVQAGIAAAPRTVAGIPA